MSWRTLRKHKKYNIKDEVEALEADDYDVPVNEDPYMRGMSISMSTLASSKENLIQDKVLLGLGGDREGTMGQWCPCLMSVDYFCYDRKTRVFTLLAMM